MERATLEREADRLGVVWDEEMPDGQLQAVIDARELGVDLSGFDGLPSCFGQYWDKPVEQICQECPAEPTCFTVFRRLVERTRGNGVGDPEIPQVLEVSPAAIQLAVASDPKTNLVEGPPPKPESEVKAQEPAPAPEKRKKRPPKKRPPPKEGVPRPTMAQSAMPAAALGDKASGYVSNVKGSVGRKPQKERKPRKPWGMHTWKERREKERKRSKWIAMLSPGNRLHREYKGKVWTVKVREDSYLLEQEGQAYPTLYAVTKRIVGSKVGANGRNLCAWSAAKFWNLPKLMSASPS